MLKDDTSNKISDYIKDEIVVDNVATFYQFTQLYKLTSIADITFSYIERCFSMVAETQNFLELDINLVVKILTSSGLSVHSELEVFNAANNWLTNNSEERSKFAKQLLLHVRLPFLSNPTLKYILDTTSLFSTDIECVAIVKEMFVNKKELFQNISNKYYTSRYCNQNKFNILICSGKND